MVTEVTITRMNKIFGSFQIVQLTNFKNVKMQDASSNTDPPVRSVWRQEGGKEKTFFPPSLPTLTVPLLRQFRFKLHAKRKR